MSVSERTAKAFEPGAGDLLMPERRLQRRQPRMRDIEDASFEIVGGRAAAHPDARIRSKPRGVFKSRLDAHPDAGPFPRDFAVDEPFAVSREAAGERLGVFAGTAPFPVERRQGTARLGFGVMVGAAALAVFWMAGGHALLLAPDTEIRVSATVSSSPVSTPSPLSVAEPDPVTTASVPSKADESANGSIIHAKPRPARIERAGSILMIRPRAD
ncbi:MAG: hypothetical protein RIA09_20780 [Hoeflea sp.]|uniref:hypothetical protein n=1 Tax=Hoeflea sp. TaxID=1940281 RepID=UPI0032F07B90